MTIILTNLRTSHIPRWAADMIWPEVANVVQGPEIGRDANNRDAPEQEPVSERQEAQAQLRLEMRS